MLILRRREGESIIIDKAIRITVLEVERGYGRWRVKLSIEAPDDVEVLRGELLDSFQAPKTGKEGIL